MQRTVACLLILPQPTHQQESGCIPKAHGLLSEERLESWGREGGLPGSLGAAGGDREWRHHPDAVMLDILRDWEESGRRAQTQTPPGDRVVTRQATVGG